MSDLERREFLKVMGASLAMAGLGSCSKPPAETIVPYVRSPEELIPGKPLFYATSMPHYGYAFGVLVESHFGRPIKIEGNPLHPASRGATHAAAQASILSLYDPDRSQVITKNGEISTWPAFLAEIGPFLARGKGLRLLTERVTSPALAFQIRNLLDRYAEARWHVFNPLPQNQAAGAALAIGEPLNSYAKLDRADVIVSLDSDFLADPRCAFEFSTRRPKNRLYVVESSISATGACADHRWPVRPTEIETIARNLLNGWQPAVAKDLMAHRGSSVVLVGEHLPPVVHALAHSVNEKLEAPIVYTRPVEYESQAGMDELIDDLESGRVELLVVLGGNPAYASPAFARSASRATMRVRLGEYEDETSALCQWHLPEAHYLESWGDLRAFDGTASIVQPLIAPLYGGRTANEIVAALAGEPGRSSHDLVKTFWGLSDSDWRRALHDGLIRDSTFRPIRPKVRTVEFSQSDPQEPLEVVLRPDPSIGDGRYANNAWLQELPKPITKLTWDNAALLSPATARRLGVETEDVLRIGNLNAPVLVVPLHPDETITLHYGYGRSRGGRVATGLGVNAFQFHPGRIEKTGESSRLAVTQEHFQMEAEPHRADALPSLYPDVVYEGYAWGMSIDLGRCTGCNACVIACQSENNIPVVGKEQVLAEREMHWLRIDTYFSEGRATFQPMMCQHCERAPCEVVCPVNATVHSSEGLNDMVYNRCVGTRYCSNNCPYKVRRFNFLRYQDTETPVLKLLRNPDVTVRSRGVMEKCTYCVQRINAARIEAKKQGRDIGDGEVVTACQAVCPARAIVFGNINDPDSRVSKLKADPRSFSVLAELNTRPRTTYLPPARNLNPEIP
jgi:molybdopterin-containing oxidoreductase family iron-sulfur binding subunit